MAPPKLIFWKKLKRPLSPHLLPFIIQKIWIELFWIGNDPSLQIFSKKHKFWRCYTSLIGTCQNFNEYNFLLCGWFCSNIEYECWYGFFVIGVQKSPKSWSSFIGGDDKIPKRKNIRFVSRKRPNIWGQRGVKNTQL